MTAIFYYAQGDIVDIDMSGNPSPWGWYFGQYVIMIVLLKGDKLDLARDPVNHRRTGLVRGSSFGLSGAVVYVLLSESHLLTLSPSSCLGHLGESSCKKCISHG